MISLRDLLWQFVYGGVAPTTVVGKEIAVSVVIALLLLSFYWVFQKIIFRGGINKSPRHSRTGARVLAVALATGWLLASLDLLGWWATMAAFVGVSLTFVADLAFLLATRPR